MDERLRELERQWRSSASEDDERAFLRARVRSGDLDEADLRLAAHVGHGPALALTGGEAPSLTPEWIDAFEGWGRRAMVCASLGAARAAYPKKRKGFLRPSGLKGPFAVTEAWLREHCSVAPGGERSPFDGVRLPQIFGGRSPEGSSYLVDGWAGRDPPEGSLPGDPTETTYYRDDVPYGACLRIEGPARLRRAAETFHRAALHDARGCWSFDGSLAAGRYKQNAIVGFALRSIGEACGATFDTAPRERWRAAVCAASHAVHQLRRTSVARALEAFNSGAPPVGDPAPLLEAVRIELCVWILGYGEDYRRMVKEALQEAIDAQDPCTCMPKPGTPEGKAQGITWSAYYKRRPCPLHKR